MRAAGLPAAQPPYVSAEPADGPAGRQPEAGAAGAAGGGGPPGGGDAGGTYARAAGRLAAGAGAAAGRPSGRAVPSTSWPGDCTTLAPSGRSGRSGRDASAARGVPAGAAGERRRWRTRRPRRRPPPGARPREEDAPGNSSARRRPSGIPRTSERPARPVCCGDTVRARRTDHSRRRHRPAVHRDTSPGAPDRTGPSARGTAARGTTGARMASGSAPLKIGVIGLGDIAQKAYLPVLTAQPGLELHLHTRTPATLDEVGDAYRLPHRHTTLDALLDQGLDAAFVHAPTDRHVEIGTRLVEAGVPLYVDKPLAYDLAALARPGGTRRGARGAARGRLQPPPRARLRAVPGPPARPDPHAEEPDRPRRGAAPGGLRRLRARGRHAALPRARPDRAGTGLRAGARAGCCTTWCCTCRATASPRSAR